MDVGQIMMQMPTGIASTASAPASAEMAAAPTGEQSDSIFAGMLRGMSPLISGTPAVVADAAITGITVAPDSGGETTVSKPADVNTDIMAALLAVVGSRDQMPTAVAADAENKPEKRVESAQPDALMPQDVALFAAGTQIVLSAGGNGRMPESGQKVEPQDNDRNLLQRSVGLAGEVAMPASETNGFSRTVMAAQLGQPVELSQSAMTTPKADSMLNSETTAGKTDAANFPKVVAREGGRDMLEKSVPVASSPAGAKMETAVRSAEEAPVVQRPVEAKSSLLTVATAANGVVASEAPAVQAGRAQEVRPAQADVNIRPIAENTPEQLDVPADVRVIRASAAVHLNPAIGVPEAGGKKTDNQDDGTLVHLDTATIKNNLESVAAAVTKASSSSVPEKELLNEGGKDTSDHGMNGQFHQPATHQPVKADMGTSLGSTPGAGQKDASHSDMAENVFRQVKEVLVNREVKTGNEQITMRLSPEHLGELTLNLKMENQQLKVEIVAANRGVRDALMQQAENLKESLSRQNITMESFDVVTSGGQRGFEQNDRGWKQLAQQQFMAGTSSGGYRYLAPEVDVGAVPQYGMQKQYAMVDVHY